MANIGGFEIPVELPSFGIGGAGVWFGIALIFLIVILGGVAIFLMQRFKVYNKKIIVFENISGQGYQPLPDCRRCLSQSRRCRGRRAS